MRTRIALFLISLLAASIVYADLCSTTGPITIPACPVVVEPPPVPPPPPPPPPPPSLVATTLPFGGTSQSFSDVIGAGQTKLYICTIPAGQISTRAGLALVDQYPGVDMIITQAGYPLTNDDISLFFADMLLWYSNPFNLGSAYVLTYPPTVWGKKDPTGTAGTTIIMRQGVTNPILPGSYYLAVRNAGSKVVRFYLYWKTY